MQLKSGDHGRANGRYPASESALAFAGTSISAPATTEPMMALSLHLPTVSLFESAQPRTKNTTRITNPIEAAGVRYRASAVLRK